MHDLRWRLAALSPEQRMLLAERLGVQAEHDREAAAGSPRLVAYVVPAEGGAGAPELAELRGFLRQKLPEPMVPSEFVLLDELPRLPSGKVDLRALPNPESTRGELSPAFVPPRSVIEQALAGVWAEVLGVERIGVHDNFFEIGGDSILSIQVVARANRVGFTLTPDQLFEHPTISRLAAVVGTLPALAAEQGLVAGPAPLTPIQHWFFEQPLAEPHHWHQVMWFEAPPELDPGVLEEAVRRVVLHHDALRLRFARRASGWQQFHTRPDGHAAVVQVDLSAVPEADKALALARAPGELAGSTDLAEGPLLRVSRFVRGGGRPDRVLIAVHHLIVDPISWGILIEDLTSACTQLSRGEEIVLPRKTTSLKAWSEALAAYAAAPRLREERDHWLALPQHVPRVPVDGAGAFSEASAATVVVSLGAEETRSLLHDAAAAYNTNPEEILLTALVQSSEPWLGAARLLVGIERHGREAVAEGIDLSRTVGWFTSFFPVLLQLEGIHEPGRAIKAIKEQLRRVPRRGIGYGVLRYLSTEAEVSARLRALPQPELVFNYAGRAEASRAAEGLLRTLGLPASSRGPRNRRSHLLEINAFAAEDRLQLHWSYSTEVHRRATLERLAHNHLEAVRALLAHCVSPGTGGYTPSDFPEAGLSQEELDRFMDRLFL